MTIAVTRTYADLNAPIPGAVSGRVLQCFYAIIDVTTIAVATNAVTLGYLPKHAIPVGGYLSCADLDTGTEVLDMDLGILANASYGGTDVADPDFFVNGGVFTGDNAITDFPFTNAVNVRMLTGPFPALQLTAKTPVSLITNTAANATGLGKVVACIFYLMPGNAVS